VLMPLMLDLLVLLVFKSFDFIYDGTALPELLSCISSVFCLSTFLFCFIGRVRVSYLV
jgi:hypothetical protein